MVKEGYKETEIGIIPEDWDVRKIGDFTNAIAGGTPSTYRQEYWNGNILWMSSGELNKRRIYDVLGRITTSGYNNSSTHLVPQGCVLMGLAGQGKTRGTVAVNYIELCTNQSIAAIFPSSEHSTEFLYQNLWSRYEELRELSSGDGGRGGLNLSIIKNLHCPFPELEEQQKIAEALFDMDNLISSLEKLIEKKKDIKQGTMQELLTGKKRLSGFSGEIIYKPLKELCEVFVDGDWIESKDQSSDGIRLIQTGNIGVGKYLDKDDKQRFISEDTFKKLNCFEIFEDDVLVSRLPEPAGRACILPSSRKRRITAVDCTIIRLKNYNPVLFVAYSQTKEYQNKVDMAMAGSTRQRISRKELGEIPIPVFPSKEEQDTIASILSDMDAEISALGQKLAKCQKLKQGMMQQLLTGKIRLV